MKHEEVKLTNHGFTLSGLLTRPTSKSENAVLLLHPHPLYGGDKDNPVIIELEQLFLEMNFITLRFDFRGVSNKFQGYDGLFGATEDTFIAMDFMEKYGLNSLGLVGYSFGGSTAIRVASSRPVRFLVTLSASYQLCLEGGYDESNLRRIECPVLMFHGNSDNIIPPTDLNLFSSLVSDIKIVSLESENHFYQYKLPKVLDAIRLFISLIFKG